MIHDLDVVLAFVKSPVTSVDAVGIPGVEQERGHRQRAAALRQRLRRQPHRQPRQPGADAQDPRVQRRPTNPSYISLDYRAQEGFIYRIARDGEEESSLLKKVLAAKLGIGKDSTIVSQFAGKKIVREPVPIAKDEPLKLELQHFVECVREKQTPDGQRRIRQTRAGSGV